MTKKAVNEVKCYDWMTSPRGTAMNGYGTEMCLKPVPCDRDSGARIVVLAGKKKGQLKEYSLKEWNSGKIQIIWMWPGIRISTLLKLLRENRLVGSALTDVTALRAVTAGKKPSSSCAASEGWANDIVKQEDAKHNDLKQFKKEQAKKDKANSESKKPLRKRSSDGEVHTERPVRKGRKRSDSSSRKQESGDESKSRPGSRVAGRRRSSDSSKAKSRVDTKKRTRSSH